MLIVKSYIKFAVIISAIICVNSSCKKYLDEKSDSGFAIPETLIDLQGLLDNYPVMNNREISAGEISSDDFYLTTTDYLALSNEYQRRMYTWDKERVFVPASNDWKNQYAVVYQSNIVLEHLNKIAFNSSNAGEFNNVKGQALFFRGKSFFNIASICSKNYDAGTSSNDLGIPLRTSSDFNERSVRSNVEQTYVQITRDLLQAINLLPVNPKHVMRPSKAAAYGLLARVYLSMRQYDKAGLYADSCLQLKSTLIDYNGLNANANFPFTQFNSEVIFESVMFSPVTLSQSSAKIDPLLYLDYTDNDLRKLLFFRSNGNNTYGFKGSYEGSTSLFVGISTNEMYLIKAETEARKGDTFIAMNTLNLLLRKRYKSPFTDLTAPNATIALSMILKERRKELIMRGLRWIDLKRLNRDGANITLSRIVNNQTYSLSPNDERYALAIPEDVIELSGIQQNPR